MYICLRMKKITYISILTLSLVFVSCSKQNITPNTQADQDVPVWEKGVSRTTITGDDLGDDSTDNGGIVDPNYDPDGKSKRN